MNFIRKFMSKKEEPKAGENYMDKVGAAPLQTQEEQDHTRQLMEDEMAEQRSRRESDSDKQTP